MKTAIMRVTFIKRFKVPFTFILTNYHGSTTNQFIMHQSAKSFPDAFNARLG